MLKNGGTKMKFLVNGKKYDCIITAWTPIRYFVRYRESFTTAWGRVTNIENFNVKEQEKLLMQLFYTAINGGDLTFTQFQKEAEADEDFYSSAFLLYTMVFENNCKKRESTDYGIEYDEFVFLASFGKSGLPEKILDELVYFDVMEIMSIQGDLSNPESYKYKMATSEESKVALGVSKKDEEELEKFLMGGEK